MTPLPCLFLGDELSGRQRAEAGLDHSRRWAPCEHPDRPLGPYVCPCAGCGPTCPSYLPDPQLEPIE